jgi:hypothetical protein
VRQRLSGNPSAPRPDSGGLLTGVLCRGGEAIRGGSRTTRTSSRNRARRERPRAASVFHPHLQRRVAPPEDIAKASGSGSEK